MAQLSAPITYRTLLAFAVPMIISHLVMNVNFIVDGFFVAHAVGTDGLSAINIVMPFIPLTIVLATMLGTGGSALVAAQLGEGKRRHAQENFSLLVLVCVILSTMIAVLGLIFLRPVLYFFGADDALYPLCEVYAVPLFVSTPLTMAGLILDIFLVAAGQPRLAMLSFLVGGIVNMVLDYILLFVLDWGLGGVAVATATGFSISAFVGLWYFVIHRRGTLRLVRPVWRLRTVLSAMGNGSSEMVMQLSMSIIMIVMNNTMMRLAGADGVAAIAISEYISGLLTAIYMGYAEGVAPLASFNYGKRDTHALRGILRRSLTLITAFSLFTTAVSILIAAPLTQIFVPATSHVYDLAVTGFRLYAIGFLFAGFGTYGSSFFTALGDGRTSALLSFCHTMLFLLGFLLLLPRFFGIHGVFMATPAADFLGACMVFAFLWKKRKLYGYA
ncbi:MATE family efflux transporter [Selenomonas sp. F0473]|uniref:MATE family efflux transporter n=1 Tax=Selenomonas sp. F0473 TaxID=999423 RepID=UPI00029E7F8C|nr:MATE family efflux transporter [Selenomonas sp. F0473]EKU70858.1 MATE efflux family protein [Selenomonas sp. F0473]